MWHFGDPLQDSILLFIYSQGTLVPIHSIDGRTTEDSRTKDDLHAALRVLTKRYSTNTCTHPHLSWHKNNWINLNYYTVLRYLVTALQVFKRKFSPNKHCTICKGFFRHPFELFPFWLFHLPSSSGNYFFVCVFHNSFHLTIFLRLKRMYLRS